MLTLGAVTAVGTALFWFFLINPWNFAYGGRIASVAFGVVIAGAALTASVPIPSKPARRIAAFTGVSVALLLSVLFLLLSLWGASGVRSSRVHDVSPDGDTRLVLVIRDGLRKNSAAEVKLQSGRKPFHQERTVWSTSSLGAPQRIRFTGSRTIEIVFAGDTFRTEYDPDTLEAGRRYTS